MKPVNAILTKSVAQQLPMSTRAVLIQGTSTDMDEIKFTICFCVSGNSVLMVHRKRQPNQFRWNGIGGKLEPGESPRDGVAREVLEETGIDINQAASVDYVGIVSWPDAPLRGNKAGGMHAFIARFDEASVRWDGVRLSDEGDLAWHPLDWVCDRSNPSVVDNISHFLPEMLKSTKPHLYRCLYEDGEFRSVEIELLNSETP